MKEPIKNKPQISTPLDTILEGESYETKCKILEVVRRTGIEPDDPTFLMLVALTHAQIVISPLSESLAKQEATLLAIQRQIESDSKNFQTRANQFLQSAEQLQNTLKMTTFGGNQLAPQREASPQTLATTPNLIQGAILGAIVASVITSLLFITLIRPQSGYKTGLRSVAPITLITHSPKELPL